MFIDFKLKVLNNLFYMSHFMHTAGKQFINYKKKLIDRPNKLVNYYYYLF